MTAPFRISGSIIGNTTVGTAVGDCGLGSGCAKLGGGVTSAARETEHPERNPKKMNAKKM
jgi:hypothetical protein